VEFNSFGPAVGRLGSDSSGGWGGANFAKVEAGGLSPLTLTTGKAQEKEKEKVVGIYIITSAMQHDYKC